MHLINLDILNLNFKNIFKLKKYQGKLMSHLQNVPANSVLIQI